MVKDSSVSERKPTDSFALFRQKGGESGFTRKHFLFNDTLHIWFTIIWCRTYIWLERNVLFNDALNTIYLRLYGVRHMVKGHSDSERGNPLPPHGLLFSIDSKGSFICSMGPPHEGSIRRPIAPWANVLTTELHLAPIWCRTYGFG